jgi:hypothetical protein
MHTHARSQRELSDVEAKSAEFEARLQHEASKLEAYGGELAGVEKAHAGALPPPPHRAAAAAAAADAPSRRTLPALPAAPPPSGLAAPARVTPGRGSAVRATEKAAGTRAKKEK